MPAATRTPTEQAALASVGVILRAGLERIKRNRPSVEAGERSEEHHEHPYININPKS